MRIIVEKPNGNEEDSIIVRCRHVSQELLSYLNAQATQSDKLVAYLNSQIHLLHPSKVFYIEAVDNKTFIYCEKAVYDSKQKLYDLEKTLEFNDFLRVSKSLIVNLRNIRFLSPAFSGRLEAELKNGERVIISRQYVPVLKKALGI